MPTMYEQDTELDEDYELDEREYNQLLYNETIDNINAAEDAEVIDEEDAEAYRINALAELEQRLLIAEGYDPEDVEDMYDDDEEYSEGMDLAEFSTSTSTRFGAALLELGEANGYDDVESYVYDLAEATDNDPEDIVGLITGDVAPDDELAIYLGEMFDLPEDYQLDLVAAGMEARGEDPYDDEDEYYDEEDDEELDLDYDDDVDASEGEVALEYSQYNNERISELENQLAEFHVGSALKDELAFLEQDVVRGVNEGWMTPAKGRQLLGTFDREEDRVASFSQMADSNGVDLATQVFAMRYAVGLDEKAGPIANFNQMIEEPITMEEYEEEVEVADQARRNVLARIGVLLERQ